MKLKVTKFLQCSIGATALLMAIYSAEGQVGGNPYDTDTGNPFLRKKTSPTPSPGATAAAKTKAATLSEKDKDFLVKAVSDGGWEVKTSAMVEKKLQNPAVKDLAAKLAADHSKMNSELVALAKKKGLDIAPDSVKGQSIPGPNYDKNYLTLVEQDHQELLGVFQKEASSGQDPDINASAAKMLPSLRQHSASVKSTQAKLQ